MKKYKLFFIWHAAVVKSYQEYLARLAEYDDLEITLLIPQKSIEGSRTIKAYVPESAKYKVIVGYALCPEDPLISIYPLLPLYLKKEKPDLIHLFEEPWHNLAAYLTFWKKLICPQSKLIFQTFQNLIEDYPNNWRKIQNNTFKASDAAIANAQEMKEVLLHWKYEKPIHIIYPGIDTKLFTQKDSRAIKGDLGLNSFTIGYFGRMIKEKGIEDLIQASSKLSFQHQLLFIGNGKDKKYFKNLTNKAKWIDAVKPEEINGYYSAMDLLVLPSQTSPKWKEQFGRVLVEAMLCGIPVIGSSSGEIPKVIGDAGLVFKEKNSSDLAKKIKQIYLDENLRDKLISRGLKRGKQFDWRETAKKVYGVYKSVLE